MRGRKTKEDSRADELRRRLLAWKQTPEPIRPSLRELARNLSTSHQLLQHYLGGLDRWECDEMYRQAQMEKEAIRGRAEAEKRPMTPPEEERFRVCDREGIRAFARSSFLRQLEDFKERSKKGPLHRLEVKSIQIFVKCGIPGAQELLDKCLKDGVKPRKKFSTIVKDTPRREGESGEEWVRRIWDVCERYESDCPVNLTEELLDMYAGNAKKLRNNLPSIRSQNAKSFRTVEGDTGNSANVEGRKSHALA